MSGIYSNSVSTLAKMHDQSLSKGSDSSSSHLNNFVHQNLPLLSAAEAKVAVVLYLLKRQSVEAALEFRTKTPERPQRAQPRAYNRWSTADDETIRMGVEKHGYGSWKSISEMFLGKRTATEVKNRARHIRTQGSASPEVAKSVLKVPLPWLLTPHRPSRELRSSHRENLQMAVQASPTA